MHYALCISFLILIIDLFYKQNGDTSSNHFFGDIYSFILCEYTVGISYTVEWLVL